MPAADPTKWDTCPECSGRKRVVKQRCYKCAKKAYARRYHHEVRQLKKDAERPCSYDAAELARCEVERAAKRGHSVTMTPDDVDTVRVTALVGTCSRCDRFLVVDVNETVSPEEGAKPQRVYGRVYTDRTECPGVPDRTAAPRLDAFQLDYAVGGASVEPAARPRTDYTAIANSEVLA